MSTSPRQAPRISRPSIRFYFQATLLNVLEIDHERLAFQRNRGRCFRLTDVHDHFVREIPARVEALRRTVDLAERMDSAGGLPWPVSPA